RSFAAISIATNKDIKAAVESSDLNALLRSKLRKLTVDNRTYYLGRYPPRRGSARRLCPDETKRGRGTQGDRDRLCRRVRDGTPRLAGPRADRDDSGREDRALGT